jgi:excisionase family DNA binding protein
MPSVSTDNFSAGTAVHIHSPDQREELLELGRGLEEHLRQPDGRAVELVIEGGASRLRVPPPVLAAFQLVVRKLIEQGSAFVVGVEDELTTQEVADLLNVSRQYVVRLMDEGRLAHHMVGTHRRASLSDVLIFKDERDARRRGALGKLIKLTEEHGLYEDGRE